MADKFEIKVPDIGDFENVEIIDVLVKAGDTVEKETPLITLETDKAAMDVPSPAAGKIVEMKVGNGDKVSEGTVIAVLEAGDESKSKDKEQEEGIREKEEEPQVEAPKPVAEVNEAPPSPLRGEGRGEGEGTQEAVRPSADLPAVNEESFSKAHASPSVRKFARELGVDLGKVNGSGIKGRITHEDVKGFVKSVMRSGGAPGGAGLPQVHEVDFGKFGEIETKPLPRIKKISGPRLHAAWVNVPHVTQHDEADITELESMRKALKSDAEKVGAKLTPLTFVIKACVQALQEFPNFNSSLSPDGEQQVFKKYFHIGFAVDTPGGLVVPVVRDADKKDIFEIGKELGDLSEKARNGKLKAADMQGGCFSISSLGSIGGTYFTPIVNAPEVAILGVSKAQMKPVWNGKKFMPRLMLPLSLSYDHRIIDGAAAARFTTFLAEVLAERRNLVL
ncbi:MAG TPA: dihydrolipoyllysine-residue acetyltransferase [Gammaproteobacteria bacterium]